jgi:hypothetical protein
MYVSCCDVERGTILDIKKTDLSLLVVCDILGVLYNIEGTGVCTVLILEFHMTNIPAMALAVLLVVPGRLVVL